MGTWDVRIPTRNFEYKLCHGWIEYLDRLTIIYAGMIVGTISNYNEFVRDSKKLLGQYITKYGPGWLWFEPPLRVHPESLPMMNASVALHRADSWTNLSPWHVRQGFWKRAGFVRRLPQSKDMKTPNSSSSIASDDDGAVNCQNGGPKISFRCLFDSGATYPSLHGRDLGRLGIPKNVYGAQSVVSIKTTGGKLRSRIYEMFVCVLDDIGYKKDGKIHYKKLVDSTYPMLPESPHYLGSLCLVVENETPISIDHNGHEVTSRLSGLLPFMACYVSSTPGNDTLFLGESRNDVLGSHRMPAHKKWDITDSNKPKPTPILHFHKYGNPTVTFNYQLRNILD
ncbi:hypothetical protein G7Y89_g10552 [Cudoniella acicularis]|uniref:Uncharacterized protein n=1 Tax=Cudoniella acicularis TaxID=354080 RepID=A0A8H4RCJ3_9HELO|nr:hypothetical protein G7Y89_g10552 [Cudoniella acicularis]